ncbi:hypothetical protein [Brachyspira intermedia]|uniref:hypothetical protein n=1 Tax=Brachyspira intermedia TaxID=84377 RepID=UPI0030067F9B
MHKQIKVLLTVIMVLFLVISCAKNNPNSPDNNSSQNGDGSQTSSWKDNPNFKILASIWQGTDVNWSGEIYEIKDNGDNGVEFFTYGGAYGIVSYSMTVEEIVWLSDTEGMIYGQYTESWDTSSIGKYYAVAFKNLTASTISISGAYDMVTQNWIADSLEQAKEIFTVDRGSFSEYTDCKPYTAAK